MGMSQNDRLLNHLQTKGSINPMEAWGEIGLYRLAARINDLRNSGHTITRQLVTVSNRFGEKCKVAEYRLAA